jgi:hypothetical protein
VEAVKGWRTAEECGIAFTIAFSVHDTDCEHGRACKRRLTHSREFIRDDPRVAAMTELAERFVKLALDKERDRLLAAIPGLAAGTATDLPGTIDNLTKSWRYLHGQKKVVGEMMKEIGSIEDDLVAARQGKLSPTANRMAYGLEVSSLFGRRHKVRVDDVLTRLRRIHSLRRR